MQDKYNSLIELLVAWFGGASTTIIAALAGRLMWHTSQVRKMRRRFFGKKLLLELPIAFGMGLVGDSLSMWLGLERFASIGVIVTVAHLGPRGVEALFMRWFGAKVS